LVGKAIFLKKKKFAGSHSCVDISALFFMEVCTVLCVSKYSSTDHILWWRI